VPKAYFRVQTCQLYNYRVNRSVWQKGRFMENLQCFVRNSAGFAASRRWHPMGRFGKIVAGM
jgi:hypothetical protein